MTMSDTLGDMLTRIRNGQKAKKAVISVPASTLKTRVLDVLQDEGFIRGYSLEEIGNNRKNILVELKYDEGKPVIQNLTRVSKPGRRIYSSAGDIPRTYNGLGVTVVSTSKGVMPDYQARKDGVGGEVLCQVF